MINSQGTPRRSAKQSFRRVFDGVSTIVQRQIVEEALIPFLDTIPRNDARRVIVKARQIAKRSEGVPQLDLTSKKSEVNGLLDELAKDTKAFTRQDASKYETLLREVVESVSEWLNDLWIITHEFGLDFPRAHSCLLFSMGVLDHVQGMKGGGCRCVFSTVYVPITIKDSDGNVIKEFSELGLVNVESAILWVWREVFVALLASKIPMFIKLIPEYLAEIDDIIGWRGLERLILGGETCSQYALELGRRYNRISCGRHDEDIDCDLESDDLDDMFYADHWSSKYIRRVPRLRKLVQDRMIEIFKASPSVPLFTTLVSLSTDDAVNELYEILAYLAPTSSVSLATAIEIYAFVKMPDAIASLLETHAFLLRPCDAEALQHAARALAGSLAGSLRLRALLLVEKELLDTARALHHALRGPFLHLDTETQRSELTSIAKMRRGSAARAERVEQWVDRASTPGLGPANPMAFAAMMMGLPLPALDLDEADQLGFIDLDPHDPDFMDLREEYRPDLKGRFDGWVETAEGITGGSTVLEKVYKQVHSVMPWILGSDIVEEMIGRIADKPSKHHVCDALESLATFARSQRKKRKKNSKAASTRGQNRAAAMPTLVEDGMQTDDVPAEALGTPDEPEVGDDNAEGEDAYDQNGEENYEGNDMETFEENNEENEGDSEEEPETEAPLQWVAEPAPIPFFPILGGIEDLD